MRCAPWRDEAQSEKVADSASADSLDAEDELEETEGVRVMRGMAGGGGSIPTSGHAYAKKSARSEIWAGNLKHAIGTWIRALRKPSAPCHE